MNRGSHSSALERSERVGSASMRPRFMNRGSLKEPVESKGNPTSFNEAPIHESGKYSCIMPPLHSVKCFNEAPIHESGKCRWLFRKRRWSFRLQ